LHYGVNLKNICAREQLKSTFPDPVVQRIVDLDMEILDAYAKELSEIEWFIGQQAKQHNPVHLKLLKMMYGISIILPLTILYVFIVSTLLGSDNDRRSIRFC